MDQIDRGAAAEVVHRCPGIHGVPAESAADHGQRPVHHQRLPADAAEHEPEGDLRLGAAKSWTRCARLPGFVDVNSRPADRQPAGDASISTATARSRSASRRSRSRTRFMSSYGDRQVSMIYPPANEYAGDPRSAAAISAHARMRCRSSTCVRRRRRWCRSNRVVNVEAHRRPAEHQSLRPVAGGDDLVQPAARLFAGRGRAQTWTTAIREMRMPATITAASREP